MANRKKPILDEFVRGLSSLGTVICLVQNSTQFARMSESVRKVADRPGLMYLNDWYGQRRD